MLTYGLAVGAACVAGFCLRRYSHLLVTAYMVGWAILPAVALPPSSSGLHPASILISIGLFFTWLDDRTYATSLAQAWRIELFLIPIALGLVTVVSLQHRPVDLGLLVNQTFAPAAALALVVTLTERERDLVIRVFLVVALLESAFAILQQHESSPLLYLDAYPLSVIKSEAGDGARWMGTLDHPLVLATIVLPALALMDNVRKMLHEVAASIMLILGALASQSRTAAILLPVTAVALIASPRASRRRRRQRGVLWLSIALLAIISFRTTGLASRFGQGGTNSTLDRQSAYDVWTHVASNFAWQPQGSGMSYVVAQTAGLGSSFENPFFMYWIDFGALIACGWFGWQLVTVIRGLRPRCYSMLTVGAAATTISIQSFSSVAANSAVGAFTMIMFGLLIADTGTRRAPRASRVRARSGGVGEVESGGT